VCVLSPTLLPFQMLHADQCKPEENPRDRHSSFAMLFRKNSREERNVEEKVEEKRR